MGFPGRGTELLAQVRELLAPEPPLLQEQAPKVVDEDKAALMRRIAALAVAEDDAALHAVHRQAAAPAIALRVQAAPVELCPPAASVTAQPQVGRESTAACTCGAAPAATLVRAGD